jgi:protein O-GlcNAc transferase
MRAPQLWYVLIMTTPATPQPPLTVDQALRQAVIYHDAGQLLDAERLYRAILQVMPLHPDANHNLGVLVVQLKLPLAALDFLKIALEQSPNQLTYCVHYVEALLQAGQASLARQVLAEARACGLATETLDALDAVAGRLGADEAEMNALIALFNQGRYAEVERLALAMTEQFPLHSFGWKVLGALNKKLGRLEAALKLMQRAAELSPTDAETHSNLGALLRELGQLEQAQASCRRALELRPEFAEAHNNLGNTLKELGHPSAAQASYQRALELKPDYAEAYNNLGVVFTELGDFAAAQGSCRRALELKPDYVEAHNNLGIALQALGRLSEAQACYHTTLALRPDYAEAYNNLGTVFKELGHYTQARLSYQSALRIKPDHAETLCNLGHLYLAQGRFAEARTCYLRSLELKPNQAAVHNSLGYVLKELGLLTDAEASCRRAIELKPDFAGAFSNLGIILVESGRLAEAEISYRRALEIEPANSAMHSNLLCALNFTAHHGVAYCLEEARRFGRAVSPPAAAQFSVWPCAAVEPERLRIGLVSADLRNHPVGYFLEGLLPQLGGKRIELFVYASHRGDDGLTARLKPHCAAWHVTADLSDEAVACQIHADGIHILLDLGGHTAHNRLPIFAWKPAPVQASWLGYFATTGMAQMDYVLVDAVGVPAAAAHQFTERLCYLPDTRLCFTAPHDAPDLTPLPGLKQNSITLASFQNLAKITEPVLALWSRVLAGVPGARLRLQNKALGDPVVRDTLLGRLRRHGLDPARVDLAGQMTRADYLAAHAEVDFILDTFPYPGGTTTCEALWMGVPTLTLAGHTLLARQGASVLTAAGLSAWVAHDEDDFVAKAVAYAGDLKQLAVLRAGLREQVAHSPLFDAPRFSRNLEAALWYMWRDRPRAASA